MTAHESLSLFANTFSSENELLSFFIEHIPDCLYFKDVESRFVCVSRTLVKFLGQSDSSDLIGKTDFDFYPAEEAQACFDDEQWMMRTGEPIIGKVEKKGLLGGEPKWVIT